MRRICAKKYFEDLINLQIIHLRKSAAYVDVCVEFAQIIFLLNCANCAKICAGVCPCASKNHYFAPRIRAFRRLGIYSTEDVNKKVARVFFLRKWNEIQSWTLSPPPGRRELKSKKIPRLFRKYYKVSRFAFSLNFVILFPSLEVWIKVYSERFWRLSRASPIKGFFCNAEGFFFMLVP